MNRTRALLTAGVTTALSAWAIAATAAAQGVFGSGAEESPQLTGAAPAPAAAAATAPVVRELEPIIIQGSPPPSILAEVAPAAAVAANSASNVGDGRHGSDDGPLHDLNDDHGGSRHDDNDDDRHGGHGGDDDDDDRHGGHGGDEDDDDDRHGGHGGDDDDDDDRHGGDDDDRD